MRSLPFLIVIIFFIASCKENKSSEAKSDATDSTAKTMMPGDNKEGIFTGSLDILKIDSASFAKLGTEKPRKNWTIFRYYIDNSNAITLAGWSATNGGGQFHGSGAPFPAPNIVLTKGDPSPVKYGPGDYFGNLVLRPKQLDSIQLKLKLIGSKSVLFVPVINDHQITYKIFLSGPGKSDISINVIPTDEELNPSPPRNSSSN